MTEISKVVTARHALGIAILGVVVSLWVASSFLMRSIFGDDKTYDKPFFVTWINTCTFSFYLIPWGIRNLISRSKRRRFNGKPTGDIRSAPGDEDGTELIDRSSRSPLLNFTPRDEEEQEADVPLLSNHSVRTFGSHDVRTTDSDLEPLTTMETARLGCVFSLIWFAANYFGNISLSYTNVASFTIISSLSGFFTLAIGSILGVEIFTTAKFMALCISILGVVLVATQDTQQSDVKDFLTDLIIGDILALIGAALYGVYTVFLKYKVRNEERVSMPLFFGFVGVFNLLMLWPVIIVLDVVGMEPFSLPADRATWIVVIVNASITFVSDYLWVLAMLMTSPLVVTVGISMSIPLALLGDHIIYDRSADLLFFLGAALVFGSFIAINISYKTDQQQQNIEQEIAASEAEGVSSSGSIHSEDEL